jgi:hypothetical protein
VNYRAALFSILILTVLASCTKIESTDIGSGLIPPIDNVNTFEVNLNTITENLLDTGSAFPLASDNLALGRINNDPLFGKTTGIVNFEVRPPYFPFAFLGKKANLQLDSMVLVLSYRGVWGDSTKAQTLNVHEIKQSNQLSLDSIYSTKKEFGHENTVLGSVTVDPRNLDDSVKSYHELAKNQLRIKITDAAFQQRVFKTFDTSGTTAHNGAYDSLRHYRNNFAGLAVVPDTVGNTTSNSLLLVNLADTNSKFAIYYRYRMPDSTHDDTSVVYFRGGLGYSNTIIRNYTGAQLNTYTAAGADSLIYLQTKPSGTFGSQGAPYAKIKIPGLDTLSNKIIHRAELIVEQVPDNTTLDDYFGAPNLFLSAYGSDSSRRFILPGGDVEFTTSGVSNISSFGSLPFKRSGVINYNFNVTRYVQGIATRKNRNYDLILSAPFDEYILISENFNTSIPISSSGIFNQVAIGRLRVGGGSHSARRMRLRIIYTKI